MVRIYRNLGLVLATALTLAACATRTPTPLGPVAPSRPGPVPVPAVPAPPPARPETFAELPGWAADDHAAGFEAFRTTCGVARDPALAEVCRRARAQGPLDAGRARAFFEENFRPELIVGEGILTAYFSPEYQARDRPDAEFSAPVRPKPADLVMSGPGGKDAARRGPNGALQPYPDRAEIERQAGGQALAWMRPEELFFLQVQGSGVLTFPDGRRRKAVFAATNGRPFAGIANPMRHMGLLPADNTSGESIRAWLAANRGPAADEVMRLNPRYVFFTLAPDDGRQPAGAAGRTPSTATVTRCSRARCTRLSVAPVMSGVSP